MTEAMDLLAASQNGAGWEEVIAGKPRAEHPKLG